MTLENLYYGVFDSKKYGSILLGLCDSKLAFLGFTHDPQEMTPHYKNRAFIEDRQSTQIVFDDLSNKGYSESSKINLFFTGTPFQCEVWKALQKIPRGETRSYQHIAHAIGRPKAVRAVGTAIGHNPISLLIPCHRVVCSDGKIGHYRWGSSLKRKLLQYENYSP